MKHVIRRLGLSVERPSTSQAYANAYIIDGYFVRFVIVAPAYRLRRHRTLLFRSFVCPTQLMTAILIYTTAAVIEWMVLFESGEAGREQKNPLAFIPTDGGTVDDVSSQCRQDRGDWPLTAIVRRDAKYLWNIK